MYDVCMQVYKSIECKASKQTNICLVSIQDNCSDFDDPVFVRTKPCGLEVQHHNLRLATHSSADVVIITTSASYDTTSYTIASTIAITYCIADTTVTESSYSSKVMHTITTPTIAIRTTITNSITTIITTNTTLSETFTYIAAHNSAIIINVLLVSACSSAYLSSSRVTVPQYWQRYFTLL